MTLGRFSILLTVLLVAVPFVGTLGSGSPMHTSWLLIAPFVPYLAYRSDYSDWTLGHVLDHFRGEDPVEVDLADALRPPIPTAPPADNGTFFVPDCPPLAPPSR